MPPRKQIRTWAKSHSRGKLYQLTVHSLQPVSQHRPVGFLKDISADLDRIVRSDREEESVKGRMVQLTERNAVWHNRLALRIGIRKNVSSVEQFFVAQAAKSTLLPIGVNHAFAKCRLMNALSYYRRDVTAADFGGGIFGQRREVDSGLKRQGVVNGHRKGERSGIIVDHEDRPHRQVLPLNERVKVDQRFAAANQLAQTHVVPMIWVAPSVPIL